MLTLDPEVSTKPPSPPRSPPLAERVPPMMAELSGLLKSAMRMMSPPLPLLPGAASAVTVPVFSIFREAASRITPPLFTKPVACKLPVFLTTPLCNWLAAWADKIIKPPGACTAWPFSTNETMVAGLTKMLVRLFCLSNSSSNESPDAKATVPSLATTKPPLRTSGANKAT